MNEERIAIEMVVAIMVWLAAVIASFWLIGAGVGIIVILVGVGLFVWWLARVIRSEPEPPAQEPPEQG
jgi:fatty acid desaturase